MKFHNLFSFTLSRYTVTMLIIKAEQDRQQKLLRLQSPYWNRVEESMSTLDFGNDEGRTGGQDVTTAITKALSLKASSLVPRV